MTSNRTLSQRLVDIMQEVGSIGKDAENTLQKYSFRSSDAVLSKLQPLFVKHGVELDPNVREQHISERVVSNNGKESVVTSCHTIMEYKLTNMDDSADFKVLSMGGYGTDYSDKAVNKAETAALKYFLCQKFMIPYGEDGDEDSPELPGKGVGSQRPKGWKPAGAQDSAGPSHLGAATPQGASSQFSDVACPECGVVGQIRKSKPEYQNKEGTKYYCNGYGQASGCKEALILYDPGDEAAFFMSERDYKETMAEQLR